ncbi:hypothetical protein FLAG1_01303 [Fusarium langsethiae]|uniref:Uncharacterized protein n=1 Tax=Fusarium langsethiae TaxID=179993 RepID=A0A0M9F4I5_FUSLA|nr:hypothetical protein FLAG1_01303 [Fusarium langsethiae]GKT98542.1 unnamed protein product [Fusarium langsethiae]GKU13303.1 unnamed protein product [Fusarium langsethiae]
MDSARTPKTPLRRPGQRIFKTTKTCSIPSLTHLRKELGYGTRGEKRDIAFKRAIRTQIKTFVSSSDRIPAYKLTKWKNTVHQRGLLEVTKDFLEVQGKGSEFWPQRDVSDTTQPLQYWKDSAKIRGLMTKVFWRAAREDKRHRTAYSIPPLLSQSTDTACQSEGNSGDTKHPLQNSTTHLKGNSAEDPIDLETMQSTVSAAGPSRDNGPFTGVLIRFNTFAPAEDSLDEPTSSEPFSSSLFASDVLDCQPTGAADGHQAAPEARMQGNDPWEVPNSPIVAASVGQQTSKRPAEASSNDNNHQAKCPRKETASSGKPAHLPNKSKKGNRKPDPASAIRPPSSRPRKQTVRPNSATEEEMIQQIDNSSESNDETRQRQQSKGKASNQVSQVSSSHSRDPAAPSGSTGEQASAQVAREATAVGVEGQPRVATGLSAKAQGKQPALPTRQTAVAEAGPSREREVIEESAPRTEASAPVAEMGVPMVETNIPTAEISNLRTETSVPMAEMSAPQTAHLSTANGSGGSDEQEQQQEQQEDISIVKTEQEQQALDRCELICMTNVEDGVTWVIQRFSTSFFQMSLADLFREAGLDDPATLCLVFRGGKHDWKLTLERNGDRKRRFSSIRRQWLDHITKQHRRAATRGTRAEYSLYFSNEDFTV